MLVSAVELEAVETWTVVAERGFSFYFLSLCFFPSFSPFNGSLVALRTLEVAFPVLIGIFRNGYTIYHYLVLKLYLLDMLLYGIIFSEKSEYF